MSNARIQFSTADVSKWEDIDPTLREGELVIAKKANGKYILKVGGPGGSTYLNATLVWDQDNAEQIKTDAEAAKTAAASSASAAAGSASAAASSASTATTKAGEAASSASAAASSQSAAAVSATAAAQSATTATNGANTATTKAGEAASSASAAASSASTATTKANEAASSASTATTKANDATDAATDASGYAQAAANSASAASTSAGEAADSATEAAESAQQAAASAASLTIDSALSTTSTNAVQNKVVTGALNGKLPIISGAAAHNSVFRGKNLGTSVTSAQWSAISSGTFEDLYIGDYWAIGGVEWVIVAFDYYFNTGDTACTTHHAVIVPRAPLYNAQMNSTDVTTGAYVGSAMYKTNINQAKTTIQNAFGSGHLLSIRQHFQNAVTNGYESGGTWYDATVWLMTEANVYGGNVFKSCTNGTNWVNWYSIDNRQYPYFRFAPLIESRWTYWLRDVAHSTGFAFVNSRGPSGADAASYSRGVRPAFCIK